MICEICKHQRSRADVLCQPCRETVTRLASICRTNPEVLATADTASEGAAGRASGAASARS